MTPLPTLRQAPIRWQRSAAACIEPSGKSKWVASGAGCGYSASRMWIGSGSASTITPGLKTPAGSKSRLTSRIAP